MSCTVETSKNFCSCGHAKKEHWHGGCRVCICDSYENMSDLIASDIGTRCDLEDHEFYSLTKLRIEDRIEIVEAFFDLYDDSFYEIEAKISTGVR